MGRPPGSRNRAKTNGSEGGDSPEGEHAGASETRTEQAPPLGHNNPRLAKVRAFLAEMMDLETAGARLRSKSAALKGRVEGDGEDWKQLKALVRAQRLSNGEATKELETLVFYHLAINVDVRTSFDPQGQGELSDVMDTEQRRPPPENAERLADARAFNDGYNSGRHGSNTFSNPHELGSSVYARWEEGRREGEADRLLINPALASRVEGGSGTIEGDEAEYRRAGVEDMRARAVSA